MRLVIDIDRRIEAGEAQRTGQRMGEREQPAEFRHHLQRPKIEYQRRRDTEGDAVRERIKFCAKTAFTAHQPGNPPVKAIEHTRKDDGTHRHFPMAGQRKAHSRQAKAQRSRRYGIGNNLPEGDPAPGYHCSTPCGAWPQPILAITVSPATVRWPSTTLGAVPAGR